ncbi:hypothetical protein ABPG72_019861 [Tetrahymena utriculariae]
MKQLIKPKFLLLFSRKINKSIFNEYDQYKLIQTNEEPDEEVEDGDKVDAENFIRLSEIQSVNKLISSYSKPQNCESGKFFAKMVSQFRETNQLCIEYLLDQIKCVTSTCQLQVPQAQQYQECILQQQQQNNTQQETPQNNDEKTSTDGDHKQEKIDENNKIQEDQEEQQEDQNEEEEKQENQEEQQEQDDGEHKQQQVQQQNNNKEKTSQNENNQEDKANSQVDLASTDQAFSAYKISVLLLSVSSELLI